MSIKNYYYVPSFLFLIVISSFILLPSDSNNNYRAYADSSSGSITITFDTNPRISSIIIDGVIYLPSQQPVTVSWKSDSSVHTFSIPQASVYESASKKYVFETWNDLDNSTTRTIKASSENNNKQLLALFKTQYLLTILSDYSTPKGAGWYELGEMATVEIDPMVSLSSDTRAVFNGWSGGHLPNSVKNYVEISKPTVIVASWKEQYRLNIESDIGSQDERNSSSNSGNAADGYVISRSGWYDRGSVARISVPQEIELKEEDGQQKKFTFKEWKSTDSGAPQISDALSPITTVVVDRPYVIKPQWVEMYYVKIISNYGNPSGEGYYKPDEVAKISVEPVHEIEPGKTRLIFSGWQEEENSGDYYSPPSSGNTALGSSTFYVTVNEPKSFKPIWTSQYFVQVKSAYGIIEGGGWYSEGSNAVVSVQQPTVNLGFGKSAMFQGWSPSTSSATLSSPSSYVISSIDRPYELRATWQVDETLRYITIIAALGATGALVLSFVTASKKKEKSVKVRYSRNNSDDAVVIDDALWAIETRSIKNTLTLM